MADNNLKRLYVWKVAIPYSSGNSSNRTGLFTVFKQFIFQSQSLILQGILLTSDELRRSNLATATMSQSLILQGILLTGFFFLSILGAKVVVSQSLILQGILLTNRPQNPKLPHPWFSRNPLFFREFF